jgi:hypothetical protein
MDDKRAVDNFAKLDKAYNAASTVKKRELIGSIFPEKLVFEGKTYRTAKVNAAVRLIYSLDEAFRRNKNGTSLDFSDLSHQVILMVQKSNRIIEGIDLVGCA